MFLTVYRSKKNPDYMHYLKHILCPSFLMLVVSEKNVIHYENYITEFESRYVTTQFLLSKGITLALFRKDMYAQFL